MAGRLLAGLDRFFGTWRFPALATGVLGGAGGLGIAMLLWPAGDTGVGAFADDFRTWCFGYDAASGELDWVLVGAFMSQPLLVFGIVALGWWPVLSRATVRGAARWVSAGALLFVVSTAAIADIRPSAGRDGVIPFPVEALRTHIPAPGIRLVDHEGHPFDLQAERGRVVMLTAVYSSCGASCPRIFEQAKAVVGSLPASERAEVLVAALALDAERDTVVAMARLARAHGVAAPGFRLLTGPPALVERRLDDLGVRRARDPVTGQVDHANTFLLVDRAGFVAYRFSLGDRQRDWLGAALRALLAER